VVIKHGRTQTAVAHN